MYHTMDTALKDMDFSKFETARKKCTYISGWPEKAVVNHLSLIPVTRMTGNPRHDTFYLHVITKNGWLYPRLYEDLGYVCVPLTYLSPYDDMSSISEGIDRYIRQELDGYDNYKRDIEDRLSKEQAITVLDIRIAELFHEPDDYIQRLKDSREQRRKRYEDEMRQNAEKKKREEAEKRADQKAALEKKAAEAGRIMREGGELRNDTVVVPKENGETYCTSLFLYLFRLYDIDVPLRTQGWVKKRLVSVNFSKDKGPVFFRIIRSGNRKSHSGVFSEYSHLLYEAMLRSEKHVTIQ